MLLSLSIRNFAIVESLEVDFGPGLNVITGETGAGKSILVGALGLILGARSDRSQIRAGAEQCAVEAIFELRDAAVLVPDLEALGISPCEDDRLIIRRTITANGSGKQWVNDSATTLQGLKRIGDALVDLHGPHEHQSLLSQTFQLDILDAFGELGEDRERYASVYTQHQGLQRQRQALTGDDGEIAQQIDLLAFRVRELESAKLEGLSEEALVAEHALLANAQEILALGQSAVSALSEDELSAFNRVVEARRHLEQAARLSDEAKPWAAEAETLAMRLRDLATNLQRKLESIDLDPARLQDLEERMALMHRLKRKYGGSVAVMLETLALSRTRLHDLESRTTRLLELDRALTESATALQTEGRRLNGKRRPAAQKLGKAVTDHLRALGFQHGQFRVDLTSGEPLASGLDTADFGFAPNVGEPMRPLRLIASSGEISRVMLATKAVLAEHDRVPVLVFDEIDANVGGEMGVAIGEKLAAVAKRRQVLCITHLPQVAAFGARHLAVEKRVAQGRTYTAITAVEGRPREEEIARMLGGKDLTTVTLRHARELLERTR